MNEKLLLQNLFTVVESCQKLIDVVKKKLKNFMTKYSTKRSFKVKNLLSYCQLKKYSNFRAIGWNKEYFWAISSKENFRVIWSKNYFPDKKNICELFDQKSIFESFVKKTFLLFWSKKYFRPNSSKTFWAIFISKLIVLWREAPQNFIMCRISLSI